jgi:hypothetical protein
MRNFSYVKMQRAQKFGDRILCFKQVLGTFLDFVVTVEFLDRQFTTFNRHVIGDKNKFALVCGIDCGMTVSCVSLLHC